MAVPTVVPWKLLRYSPPFPSTINAPVGTWAPLMALTEDETPGTGRGSQRDLMPPCMGTFEDPTGPTSTNLVAFPVM